MKSSRGLERVRQSRSDLSDGGEGSPGCDFDGDSGEEIGGEIYGTDVAGADLIKDTKHSLRIRLRDLKALRRGIDGAAARSLSAARRGLDGAITSLEEALNIMADGSPCIL